MSVPTPTSPPEAKVEPVVVEQERREDLPFVSHISLTTDVIVGTLRFYQSFGKGIGIPSVEDRLGQRTVRRRSYHFEGLLDDCSCGYIDITTR